MSELLQKHKRSHICVVPCVRIYFRTMSSQVTSIPRALINELVLVSLGNCGHWMPQFHSNYCYELSNYTLYHTYAHKIYVIECVCHGMTKKELKRLKGSKGP